MHTVAEFDVEPGDRVPFVLTWYPSNARPARARRRRGGARGDRGVLGRLDGPLHETEGAPRRADPVARHAQGADVRADRRDRRGPDHVAAGVPRRRPELGLPLLLGQGRDAHPPLARPRRVRRRGERMARLAPPRDRRLARRAAGAVRASPGSGGSPSSSSRGSRATRGRGPSASATRRARSSSSTSTARSSTRSTRRARRACRRWTTPGRSAGACSSSSRTSGASPTRGSGRCAARAATSPTRR